LKVCGNLSRTSIFASVNDRPSRRVMMVKKLTLAAGPYENCSIAAFVIPVLRVISLHMFDVSRTYDEVGNNLSMQLDDVKKNYPSIERGRHEKRSK
jgi:hypothetical protein